MRTINKNHVDYSVNEYECEVEITQSMRDQALAFAAKIKLDDNQYRRLLPVNLRGTTAENAIKLLKHEIQRTYVGKLGEMAFLAWLREKGVNYATGNMFEIYEGQENTDSYDFITNNGKTIDVKTGFRENHKNLLINKNQFENSPKDYYVGVKLLGRSISGDDKLIEWDSVKTAVIKGYAEKTYLDNKPYKDFGEGEAKMLFYKYLLRIDRLLSLF